MSDKPNILAVLKKGQAIGAVDHFAETLNWLIGYISNLKSGDGIKLLDERSDHPSIEANIVAGKGISVTRENGSIKISLSESGSGSGGSGSGSGGSGSGSGGSGSGGSGSGGSGSSGVGSVGGSNSGSHSGGGSGSLGGGGSGSGSGLGGSGSGSGKGNSCNKFSHDWENPANDSGMDNKGDNCNELNGW